MQKQKGKSDTDFVAGVMGFAERIGTSVYDWFAQTFGGVIAKFSNLAKTNHDVGYSLLERGKFKEAMFRFKIALWFNEYYPMAWYNLGCCQLALNQNKEAAQSFRRALKANPADENALYMLATADGDSLPADKLPKTMPLKMIISQFNGIADSYDYIQIEELQYRGHVEINRVIRAQLENNKNDYTVLELGCGTGLCGAMARQIAGRYHGVDVAPRMVEIASNLRDENGKAIYDGLYTEDMHSFLAKNEETGYDVIFAANVVNYVGDLSRLFPLVAAKLNAGGVFALSTEIKDDPGFAFIPALGRFAHSPAYIRDLARAHGLTPTVATESLMYPEYTSLLCVLRK